jgi:hypothetical protein
MLMMNSASSHPSAITIIPIILKTRTTCLIKVPDH